MWLKLLIHLYRIIVSILYVISYPYLAKKYSQGLNERRGIYSKGFRKYLQGGKPLWVHSVSVGEVQSALPFIHEVTEAGFPGQVVLSTTTTTGMEMAERLLPSPEVRHFYYPWDIPWIVKRSIDSIEPYAYVVMETEIWPNLIYEMHKRGIPVFLVNGRFSDRSFEKRKGKSGFWCELFSLFTLIMVREESDLNKFKALGVPENKVVVTGDCKVDALIRRAERTDLSRIRSILGDTSPVFMAGSTHTGEDIAVLEAFRILRKTEKTARLILAPRHPERSHKVREMALEYGKVSLLSQNKGDHWDILVVDSIGYLFEMYGVADGAFVGGSLVPKGGQNILEPALFGIPVAHGPFMEDFRETSEKLGSLGIACIVNTPQELACEWKKALDPSRKKVVKDLSRKFFEEVSGASKLSWDLVMKYIS